MLELVFDGGSKGNGSKNDGYGSFALLQDGKKVEMNFHYRNKAFKSTQITFDFGKATNSMAELMIALQAMSYVDVIQARIKRPIEITLISDSQNVTRLASKQMPKQKAEHLIKYYEDIILWLEDHPQATLIHKPREYIVGILGH